MTRIIPPLHDLYTARDILRARQHRLLGFTLACVTVLFVSLGALAFLLDTWWVWVDVLVGIPAGWGTFVGKRRLDTVNDRLHENQRLIDYREGRRP